MSEPERYVPAPVPQEGDLRAYLHDELQRIHNALYPDPVFVVLHYNGSVDVGTTDASDWIGQATAAETEYPTGTWDSSTYTWTCPYDGFFKWDVWANIGGTAGGQDATYTLEVYKNGSLFETPASAVAPSNQDCLLNMTDLHELQPGDTLKFELHAQKASGSTNTASYYAHVIIQFAEERP